VRDKDGISAAVLTARMAADAKREGETLLDRLERLWLRHGVHLSAQVSLRLEGPTASAQRTAMMTRLREHPPSQLAGVPVTSVRDLATGDGGLPPHDAVFLQLEGGHRVALRPSGTEPKVKLYVDVREPVSDGDVGAALERARALLTRLSDAARAHAAPST
jgi:phosphomannomutase